MTATKIAQPRVLTMRCDECGKKVGRGGYLSVDPNAAKRRASAQLQMVAIGEREPITHCRPDGTFGDTFDKTFGDSLVFWRIVHTACDRAGRPTDYRIAVDRLSTTGDLLEATAHLLRNEPWIAHTNWSGLIRRVLAETRRSAGQGRPPKRRGGTETDNDETETEGQDRD